MHGRVCVYRIRSLLIVSLTVDSRAQQQKPMGIATAVEVVYGGSVDQLESTMSPKLSTKAAETNQSNITEVCHSLCSCRVFSQVLPVAILVRYHEPLLILIWIVHIPICLLQGISPPSILTVGRPK